MLLVAAELIPIRMKIALEGFDCGHDQFETPELVIRRALLDERQAFYSRYGSSKYVDLHATENEFFVEFDFRISRGDIHGVAPVEGINLVSIFFNVFAPAKLNISKGNFLFVGDEGVQSGGFYSSPPAECRSALKRIFQKENWTI